MPVVAENSPAGLVAERVTPGPSTDPQIEVDVVAEVHQPTEHLTSTSDNEAPPSEAANIKRKRDIVTSCFTESQEQEMVEWLQSPEQECILDKKHPNYIKKDLKDALWDKKAMDMGKTADLLRKWYSNMRTRFGKLKQTPSGSGDIELTSRERWILRHFEFLKPYLIVQVKKRVTVSVSIFFLYIHFTLFYFIKIVKMYFFYNVRKSKVPFISFET